MKSGIAVGWTGLTISGRVTGKDLTEMLTSASRTEGSEGVSPVATRQESCRHEQSCRQQGRVAGIEEGQAEKLEMRPETLGTDEQIP